MPGISQDEEMIALPIRRLMYDAKHEAGYGWDLELPPVLIQDMSGTTYLEIPREFLYEFMNPDRLPEEYMHEAGWWCQRDWQEDCGSSDADYGQNYDYDSEDQEIQRLRAVAAGEMPADSYTRGPVFDTGAATDVAQIPPRVRAPPMAVSSVKSSSDDEIQMQDPENPAVLADPTYDASSGDDTATRLPELMAVDHAEVIHHPFMNAAAERIRVVYRGSVAQSSSDIPLPNTYLWSSMHGSLANHAISPVRTALSSSDAELFALATAMRRIPLLGIEENRIGDDTDSVSAADDDEDRWVGDPAELEAHRRWHEENDEYLPLRRQQLEREAELFGPQPPTDANDVATQTEFVPVLEPLRRLRGQPATPATHPDVYELLEDEDLA